ncbi:MAG: flagellar basal body P-ring formation chaperone FlgA [Desulfobacteraceae bacterium]|nr:flagellar basal body P-ring formation chaperone FlgA [Desulfobacteraceae bacterium]
MFFLLVILFGSLGLGPAWAEEAIQINLLDQATVNGDVIQLCQVAQISAPNKEEAQALGALEVGRAPLPGQSLYIHPARIEAILKPLMENGGHYQLIATAPVKVVRGHDTVSASQVRDAVAGYITAHAPWDKAQMKIRPISYDQDLIVPPGDAALEVEEPAHNDWMGAETFAVRIMVNGELARRAVVGVYIEVWQNVYVAAKPLGKNQPVNHEDIKVQRMDRAGLPANAIVREDQVVGLRANRSIAINTILREDQLEREPAVRKGDLIQVLAESSLLKITTQAVALESGCIGDRILLLNANSKKNIYGRVVDSQTVKVEY